MERIVFNQNELDITDADVTSIALCDNDYVISPVPGRKYTAIGTVSAVVKCTAIQSILMGMTFIGFIPVFDGECDAAEMPKETEIKRISSPASSFARSFTSSFASSFKSSFSSSFTASYALSYKYRSSFSGWFRDSFGGSFRTSLSFAAGSMRIRFKKRTVIREIAVNGYGLNLI